MGLKMGAMGKARARQGGMVVKTASYSKTRASQSEPPSPGTGRVKVGLRGGKEPIAWGVGCSKIPECGDG